MTCRRASRFHILTPAGTGAIGVIRLIGDDAVTIVNSLLRGKDDHRVLLRRDGKLHYASIMEAGSVIDDVLVSVVPHAPEPTVDIAAHGGPRVMTRLLQALERKGAVSCDSSDDSAAAFPCGSEMEREALDAIARCRTGRGVQHFAMLRTELPRRLRALSRDCDSVPDSFLARFDCITAGFVGSRRLIDGADVAIVGPTNAGKSTLFNRILQRERNIVSDRSGTTRDWVCEDVDLAGVPVRLIDTAGVRDGEDALENRAIDSGLEMASSADVTLFVLDASAPLESHVAPYAEWIASVSSPIVILNKSDITDRDLLERCRGYLDQLGAPVVVCSATMGTGMPNLLDRVLSELGVISGGDGVPCLFTDRQLRCHGMIRDVASDDPIKASELILSELIGL